MAILNETEKVSRDFLPLAGFKEHLKLGAGFSDDTLQETLLESHLRAALAIIETHLSKAIALRKFSLKLYDWQAPLAQTLPIAPVTELVSLKIIAQTGSETALDISDFIVAQNFDRPRLIAFSGSFPKIPEGGLADVTFKAGLAEKWADLASDIAQAVMITSAHLYEDRTGSQKIPEIAQALLEKYRTRRLGKAV